MSRALFEQLIAGGYPELEKLISDKVQENVQLDFKIKTRLSDPTLDTDEKRTLGKALSAFANSAGGLLVYGVRADKGPKKDDLDCAQELSPIPNLSRFQNELIRCSGELLMPKHEAIYIHTIEGNTPNTGFVLIWVDRSERRPHRCEAKGQKGYFKRAGDSSFEMEHYDIEDAFRRVQSPRLSVEYMQAGSMWGGGICAIQFKFFLKNNSHVSASYPFITIIDGNLAYKTSTSPEGIRFSGIGSMITYSAGSDILIHPGEKTKMFERGISLALNQEARQSIEGGSMPGGNYRFLRVRYGCKDLRSVEEEVSLDQNMVLDIFRKLIANN